MRVLVTADTHAPNRKLPDWLVRLAGRADLVLHAGDFCDFSTYGTFAALAPLYAVRGNNDLDLHLPERLLLRLAGVSVGIVHGDLGPGRSTAERALFAFPERPQVVVFGHSHAQLLQRVEGVLLLNPGSPTKPREGSPSAAWLRLGDGAADVSFCGAADV